MTNEPRLSLARAFEVFLSDGDEMSEIPTEEKLSIIWPIEYKGTAEDRARLHHQSESRTSSLGRDGAGAKARVGLLGG